MVKLYTCTHQQTEDPKKGICCFSAMGSKQHNGMRAKTGTDLVSGYCFQV